MAEPQGQEEGRREAKRAGRQRARRRATEDSILDAFDRLLERGGVSALGVNALVKEAGVGKKQLYDYFGGLAGVAGCWVRQRTVWHSLEDIIGEPWERFAARPPGEKLRHVNACYAESLRRNPRLCELLAGEFLRSEEVKAAVDHVRQLVREDFERVIASDPALRHPDMAALNLVAYTCATYLGLRAHHQPVFFGFDLSSETAWVTVMHMVDRTLARAASDLAGAES
ncbi:MAG: TetR/AcrR family transcriptional regulator [Thermaurantiacus sp.]